VSLVGATLHFRLKQAITLYERFLSEMQVHTYTGQNRCHFRR
jgi:hypothetical protein